MKCVVNDDVILSRPLEGLLSAQIAGFARRAREEGYAHRSRQQKVLLAACFSRWLGQHGISVRRVCSEHPARYLRSRARHVQAQRGDAAALRQFVDLLRRQGVVLTGKIPRRRLIPAEQVVHAFERYLRNERTQAEVTVVNYIPFVRGFLADRFGAIRPKIQFPQ